MEQPQDTKNNPLSLPRVQDSLFVPIDVQREFCDPKHSKRGNTKTVSVAKKIGKLSPIFNQHALRTCWVFYADKPNSRFAKRSCGGFYLVTPKRSDLFAGKENNSAFHRESPQFEAVLKSNGIKNLFCAGVNLSACVKETVKDALGRGYHVYLVHDLCANDKENHGTLKLFKRNIHAHLDELKKLSMGDPKQRIGSISYITSDDLLTFLKNNKNTDTDSPALNIETYQEPKPYRKRAWSALKAFFQ